MLQQPARKLDLVVVHAQVQQRSAGQRRPVQRQRLVGVAAQLRRVDLRVRERPTQEAGSRRRCASSRSIRPRCTAIGGVSGRSMPCCATSSRQRCFPSGLRQYVSRISATGASRSPVPSSRRGAEVQHERQSRAAQRLARPHHGVRAGPGAHRVQPPRRVELALEAGPVERELHVRGAELAEHRDDPVAPEVRRVRHRRPPVADHAAGVLVEQARMPRHQLTNGRHVVAPDRVGHPAGEHQSRPARQAVAAGQRALRIGEPDALRLALSRAVLLEHRDRRGIAAPDVAQQILRLVPKLIEVRADGQVAVSHDGPPSRQARVRYARAKGGSCGIAMAMRSVRWTRSCPRTGGVLHACPQDTRASPSPEAGRRLP